MSPTTHSAARKRIVITGVSRGLGRALVERLADQGHAVFGCARSATALDQLSARLRAGKFEVVDVACDAQVQAWAAQVLAAGPPDLLVNNAGLINRNARLWEVPCEEFDRLVDVNLKGVVNVIRHFLPAMIERKEGVVVNFSSTWGRSTAPDVAPYCATKWAVEGLTRALAAELPRPLAAVALNPGVIHTAMLESCFGKSAAAYPDPRNWSERAAAFLLQLGPKDNGQSVTVPAG